MRNHTLFLSLLIIVLLAVGVFLSTYFYHQHQLLQTAQTVSKTAPVISSTILQTDIPGVQLAILNTDMFLQPFLDAHYIPTSKTPLTVKITGTTQASGDKGIIEYEPSQVVILSSYTSTSSATGKTLTIGITPGFAKIATASDQLVAQNTLWQAILRSVWHTTHPSVSPTDDSGVDIKQFMLKYTQPNTEVVSVTSSM